MSVNLKDVFGDIVLDKKPENKNKNQKPRLWKVIVLNDDYSTFETVIDILKKFFRHTEESAQLVAQEIHKSGKGIAQSGLTLEIAETKVNMAMQYATKLEQPLKLGAESE